MIGECQRPMDGYSSFQLPDGTVIGAIGNLRVIGRASLLDVPRRLRAMAEEIEARGDTHRTVICVVAYPDGRVSVRGFGERTSALEATGWLTRAITGLCDGSLVESDNFCPQDPPHAA